MDLSDLGLSTARADTGGSAAEARPEPPPESPFVLIEPLHRTAPLIFASPHSGRRYPSDLLAIARTGLLSLRRSEDAFVDEIFAGAAAHGAAVLSATVARAYVDLNRDPNELDPDMFEERVPHAAPSPRVQAGLGAIPRVTGDGQPIYRRKLSLREAERRIAAIHAPYHQMLRNLVDETRTQFGCAVLIDCHSMPSNARGSYAPDIVLGDRYGVSCHPSVTALAEATLRRLGYRVARNAPFAGGHTTQSYGRPAERVHALQIEINRGLYCDERSLDRTMGFTRVRADMSRLAEALSAAALHKSLA
ncbi:N-formylglutamate amidohydrolase [Terricaulis sp.]|uniref:N-formylglutamate amidohydrolase n=1 Tax=Terricaulis sp. TaxID=2768686 RepID=UPI0037839224